MGAHSTHDFAALNVLNTSVYWILRYKFLITGRCCNHARSYAYVAECLKKAASLKTCLLAAALWLLKLATVSSLSEGRQESEGHQFSLLGTQPSRHVLHHQHVNSVLWRIHT